jgi:putative DNA methylase
MTASITPYSLKDVPALIERLLPVQKISAEAYKEQMANSGKTLTTLSGYWKGRKPLILAKACVLGCLLPATDNPTRDLEIFEKLMAMDDESFVIRGKRTYKPKEIIAKASIAKITDYFIVEPDGVIPDSAPVDLSKPEYSKVKVIWRTDISILDRRRLEAQLLPKIPYRKRVDQSLRPEQVIENVHDHIWDAVNAHLGISAHSFPELVDQLGIMHFGHRPRIADNFCGSGQIPFEAARLGSDVYASDLNPIASMLTWGALYVLGGSPESRSMLKRQQEETVAKVISEINEMGIETDGNGWSAKSYLYCLEVRCPQTGWKVPLLPSRILSYGKRAIVELVPDPQLKRYSIIVRSGVSSIEMKEAKIGTLRSDGRGQESYLLHTVNGIEYRTKISTIRGDYRKDDGKNGNKLRLWEKGDFMPRSDDIFQERLYAVHWMRPKSKGKKYDYEIRSVTEDDLRRERIVEDYVREHFYEWQAQGFLPDMRIEPGAETTRLLRERGWTYWHHLFPPRHLLIMGLLKRYSQQAGSLLMFAKVLDYTSKLCRWAPSGAGTSKPGEGKKTGGASDNSSNVFYNQALNTFYNYGCRSSFSLLQLYEGKLPSIKLEQLRSVFCKPANEIDTINDIFITDPPYGDAVNYDEILDFFISWLRKNPPLETANWIWDSRRSLAIKGNDEEFRRGMVAAYKRMSECMPDNGIQIIMFTHQSGSIWADMANIVWASGLQVTAAWYVVTETDSALREGSYVKGTAEVQTKDRTLP